MIYVALGVGVSSIFGADALNNMATNVYFNIGFFLLLIIFGASFLGAFDIQLPASWTNKSVEAESKGGMIGIFFMAFTLALVSFFSVRLVQLNIRNPNINVSRVFFIIVGNVYIKCRAT